MELNLDLGKDFRLLGFSSVEVGTLTWNIFHTDSVIEVAHVEVSSRNTFEVILHTYCKTFPLSSYDTPVLLREVSEGVIESLYRVTFGEASKPRKVACCWYLPVLETLVAPNYLSST